MQLNEALKKTCYNALGQVSCFKVTVVNNKLLSAGEKEETWGDLAAGMIIQIEQRSNEWDVEYTNTTAASGQAAAAAAAATQHV